MPWVVGIDEAGYGPNLGPLVQAAVALRLPDDDEAGWETLRPAVRRCGEKDDGRLLIDDSKKVHSGANGLAKLERGVFAALGRSAPTEFGHLLYSLSLIACLEELTREAWFDATELLPLKCELPVPSPLAAGPVAVRLVAAPAFNRVVAANGTKGAVLADGLASLLGEAVFALPDDEPVLFLCDQLGGRNYYAALLQAAFPDGWVLAERESAGESRYRVMDVGREVRVVVRPRADGGSVSVALASMLCKYLREVCMRQFNRFWARHVPDLKPTAGYPGDAKRFLEAIRPAMAKLGIAEETVWRVK